MTYILLGSLIGALPGIGLGNMPIHWSYKSFIAGWMILFFTYIYLV